MVLCSDTLSVGMAKNTLSQHCTYSTPELEQTDTRRTERSDAIRFARTTSEMVGVRLVAVRKAAARAHSPHRPPRPARSHRPSFCVPGLRTPPDNKTARVINAEAKPAGRGLPELRTRHIFSEVLYFKGLLIPLSLYLFHSSFMKLIFNSL